MNDRPIHLPPSTVPHQEPSVTCPVWITQSNLDGLQALIKWLEGFESAGKGRVPGSFELISFYRTLCSSIQAHYKPEKQ